MARAVLLKTCRLGCNQQPSKWQPSRGCGLFMVCLAHEHDATSSGCSTKAVRRQQGSNKITSAGRARQAQQGSRAQGASLGMQSHTAQGTFHGTWTQKGARRRRAYAVTCLQACQAMLPSVDVDGLVPSDLAVSVSSLTPLIYNCCTSHFFFICMTMTITITNTRSFQHGEFILFLLFLITLLNPSRSFTSVSRNLLLLNPTPIKQHSSPTSSFLCLLAAHSYLATCLPGLSDVVCNEIIENVPGAFNVQTSGPSAVTFQGDSVEVGLSALLWSR